MSTAPQPSAAAATSSPDDHGFVFVAGMHRSGTTLLARLIGSSPEASGLVDTGVTMDEGQFLQDVFPIGKELGGVTRWAYDPRAYLTEVDAAAVPDARERLWRSWSPHWDLSRRHLVEKTPLNLTRTRFLQAVFPGARFVVITRHPVAQALAVHKWSPHRTERLGAGIDTLVGQWLRAHEAFEVDRPHLEHVHVVRYEDLVANPVVEAERMQEFLGFDIDTALLADLDPARARGYADTWEDALAPGARRRTLAALPGAAVRGRSGAESAVRRLTEAAAYPRAAARVEQSYADRIARLGYGPRLDVADPAP